MPITELLLEGVLGELYHPQNFGFKNRVQKKEIDSILLSASSTTAFSLTSQG